MEERKTKNNIDLKRILKIFKDFNHIIHNCNYKNKHLAITSFLKQIRVDTPSGKIFLDFFDVPKEILKTTILESGARDRI